MTSTPSERQISSSRRRRRIRQLLGKGGVYLILSLFGFIMLFPFIVMAFSSLKTSADTFRYPPQLLPMAPATTEVNGEQLPLYELPINGKSTEVVLVEQGIRAGLFVDPTDPTVELPWPLDLATPTGRMVTLDGEQVEIYDVTVDGQVRELALKRNTAVGEFAAVDDPSAITYAVVRTAPAAEQLSFQWGNYSEVVNLDVGNLKGVGRSVTNTILVTMLVVAGILFTSIMGGYAFARIRFPLREPLFFIYLGSIMIPFIILIIPLFQLVVSLGWVNHLGALVWPFLFSAYGTFLMRQFFVTIPKDLEEAAFIDGAKRWRILWRIFVPLSWPAIAALATFSFLYAWNSFIWPLVAINPGNTDDQVLTLVLRVLGGQAADSPNLIFTGIVIAVALPMVVFIMAQRYFVENVATSGIK